MNRRELNTSWVVVLSSACLVAFTFSGCARETKPSTPVHGTTHAFDIHWPPIDPNSDDADIARPLLRGEVAVLGTHSTDGVPALEITLTISRPTSESDRQFWNSRLAYADLPWMDEVRVWDADSKWQWPNLPFLLRRTGEERVDRYGGVDPGKGVDNDFAAVLIRKYNVNGEIESPETRNTPLVSAEWHGNTMQEVDIHSVVHTAQSDTFVVHLGRDEEQSAGKIKLWLIYADFLGSRPPPTWPQEREWAGGILAYCEIDWDRFEARRYNRALRFLVPTCGTEFDWAAWSESEPKPAIAKLVDTPG